MQGSASDYTTTVRLVVTTVESASAGSVRQIVAVPDRFRAYAESDYTVIFESRNPFTVRFDGGSPLAGEPQRSHDEGVYRLTQKARPDAARVEPYKYTITMFVDGEVLEADPDGVLEPDPNRR